METIRWFDRITGDDTPNAAAKRSGVNQPTLSRQIKAGALSAEVIVAIARAYDADAIEGLIIGGLITEADVRKHGAEVLLEQITDRRIADEVYERMVEGRGVEEFLTPPTLVVISDEEAEKKPALQTVTDVDEEIEGHTDTP